MASPLDYSSHQMIWIGDAVVASVRDRIRSGLDVYDRPAPPLKAGKNGRGYPIYKAFKFGGKPIRDWWRTGQTLRSLKVITASVNRVDIGFTSPEANRRAFFNNRRWRQFGLSPQDWKALLQARTTVRKQVA